MKDCHYFQRGEILISNKIMSVAYPFNCMIIRIWLKKYHQNLNLSLWHSFVTILFISILYLVAWHKIFLLLFKFSLPCDHAYKKQTIVIPSLLFVSIYFFDILSLDRLSERKKIFGFRRFSDISHHKKRSIHILILIVPSSEFLWGLKILRVFFNHNYKHSFVILLSFVYILWLLAL